VTDTDDNDGLDDEPSAVPESQLPRLDFTTFIMSIIGSAFVHLGDAVEPGGGTIAAGAGEPNLLLAQQDIELLELLQEKTKGNLTGDEERVLDQGLYDLRMRFLEVSKQP
jgi:hypothetical protein